MDWRDLFKFVDELRNTMKKGLFGLWSILALSLALFMVVSSFDSISIGGYELKNSEMTATLTATELAPVDELLSAGSDAADTVESGAVQGLDEVAAVDTAAKTILFVGDSMLEGLSPRLAAYAEANGHTLYTVIWYSSTSKIWGDSHKLSSYIKQFHPDYVFICLGANELFVKNIIEKRDASVKGIIGEIGSLPYVWIGPPNWKDDTGINRLIADHAGPRHYFKSDGMTFERAKDGAHPTHQSASLWMDSVVRWMATNSDHPIKLDQPSKATARPKRVVVLQPQN